MAPVGTRGAPPAPSFFLAIGCAGWTIRKEHRALFANAGSHLERYASRLSAVEINSSFHRPHRPGTYARWANAVPEGFRFSVKVPKDITHDRRLLDAGPQLEAFITEASALGEKLGPLLVQLPPSLEFDKRVAERFFAVVRGLFRGPVVLEPRHATWLGEEAEHVLLDARVARVAADPARDARAASPGAWQGIRYWRLHGSPEMYVSAYPPHYLSALSDGLAASARTAETWCIFDNTKLGAATTDALATMSRTR